ncbi:MAG: PEGA domain-containing protein [Fervidobacterium sp.]|nr:PEGA domain-containing protein [Fervidobacterium sp.]
MFFKTVRYLIIIIFTFLLSSSFLALTVISENGAMVYYNGFLIGVVKNNSLSFPASFPGWLRVAKPGYLTFEKEITEDGTVVANLAFPSYLKVNVALENAELYINDIKYSPGELHALRPGYYKIKISAPGYTTKTIELFLDKNEEKILDVNLKKTVTLTINSVQKISNVLIDGKVIDVPHTLEVLPGKYRLILSGDYVKNIQEFDVPPVDSYSITLDLQKKYELQISGEPEYAYVRINNEIYRLPYRNKLSEGFYNIVIFADGYKEETRRLELKENTVINYMLEPQKLYKSNFLDKDYIVKFDGFVRERLIPKAYFTTVSDKNNNIIWVGFSDGTFNKIPTTIPILINSDYQVTINNKAYIGPAVLQIENGQKISLYNKFTGTETVIVDKLTIFDSVEKCLVNIYSKTGLDVFWDGKYIGKTPIYLFMTSSGMHELLLKKGEREIFKSLVSVSQGKLNEFSIDE